jgi:hypothetical protein
MAKLFLSYSRRDESKARRFTEWLEREGHDVWRDEDDIGAGASFSSEIEQALKDCEAVLVLWSASSVQSAWVRDEAGYGRDAGKLIPFSLDGTEPPLGFRQFQSLNVSRWKGREPPDGDRIRAAIARMAKLPLAAPPTQVRPGRISRRNALLIGGAIAVSAVTVLGVLAWHRTSGERELAIAVLPSPQSSDRAMATDYANVVAADMAAFLPRHFDEARVIAPAEGYGQVSGYRLLISANPSAAGTNASLTLSDEDRQSALWSRNWSAANTPTADLKAEVSAIASKAALCLTEARGGSERLSQPALGLYLSGCAGLGDNTLSDTDFGPIFERVTKLDPAFKPAWNYLALTRSWAAQSLQDSSPSAYAAALKSARAAIAVARRVNPNSAMSYDAEYHLIYRDHFRGLRLLEKAAQIDPEDGRIQMHLSDELTSVGRMEDSVQAAQRGVELEPVSPYAVQQYILALAYSGQFSKAKSVIADARKKWPDDTQINAAEYAFQFRYGDPRVAMKLLPKIGDFSDAEMEPSRKVIAARIDPTAAKIGEAITALSTRASNNQRARNSVLMGLVTFARVDQAYQLLQDRQFQPFLEKNALFRPDFAAVRADPRFMQVAARLGLVRYWRDSGFWPDFCSTERLGYDCKAEAAKYPN